MNGAGSFSIHTTPSTVAIGSRIAESDVGNMAVGQMTAEEEYEMRRAYLTAMLIVMIYSVMLYLYKEIVICH